MEDVKIQQCKRMSVERFTRATVYSLAAQITPLTIFLLFINFNIFHPLTWISQTVRLIFSISTWLYMAPLIMVVFLHGVVLSKIYMTRTSYYKNRFVLFLKTCGRKMMSLFTHFLVGFQTAWMFVKILECRGDNFLVMEKLWFILFSGGYMGFYYFVREKMKLKQDAQFPLIQQSRFLRIRQELYSTLYRSLKISITPTLIYVGCGIVFMPFFKDRIADYSLDYSLLIHNWNLIIYVWILASQILSNLHLMEQLFVIFLTETTQFAIEDSNGSLTISDAMAIEQFQIIQELASFDLYSLSYNSDKSRRRQIYSLSIPGGHPYNWKAISDTSLKIISEFTKELSTAVDLIAAFEKNKSIPISAQNSINNPQKGVATQAAEKIMNRQLNEGFGIRNMSLFLPENQPANQKPSFIQRLPQPQEINHSIENYLAALKDRIYNFPVIHYLLGEQHYERAYYILKRHSQRLVWITQGISGLASKSITEDNYGVVQKNLPQIIQRLLELKAVLDKVENVNLGRRKIKQHYKALKSAVKKSLYLIASSFGDYLNDLLLSDSDRASLLVYVNYKEP